MTSYATFLSYNSYSDICLLLLFAVNFVKVSY